MSARLTRSAAALFAGLILSGAAVAADPAGPAAPMAHAPKALMALSEAQIDPSRLLPPPPADGSPRQKAELAEVQRIYRTRTPERYAQAAWDDKHEDVSAFQAVLGPQFDLARLPATARLLALVDNDQSIAAGRAKAYFKRTRPWAIDTTIVPCDYKPGANPSTSYPSGHATLGYSVSYVLAALMPQKAQAILARADDYAYSREVCGDHYPSDTEASHALGVAVAVDLLNDPQVAAMADAARAELRAAGLSGAN